MYLCCKALQIAIQYNNIILIKIIINYRSNKLFLDFINIKEILIILIEIILFNVKLIFKNMKKFQ